MTTRSLLLLAIGLVGLTPGCVSRTRFHDEFRHGLGAGWTIKREDPAAWRTSDRGLELRLLPGNMWGPANDARNTLVRVAPDPARDPVEVSVRVENHPTGQYEQVDLVWYFSDSNQVKIGQELVDGNLSVVMGQEENDRTRTIAIVPLDSFVVDLRLQVVNDRIRGSYRTPAMADWKEAGVCDLPAGGAPHISLQAYQGTTNVVRWARLSRFGVEQIGRK